MGDQKLEKAVDLLDAALVAFDQDPSDAIKAAARLRTIDDPERWNDFLNARNLSVHDYVGLDDERFVAVVRDFAEAVRRLRD